MEDVGTSELKEPHVARHAVLRTAGNTLSNAEIPGCQQWRIIATCILHDINTQQSNTK